MTSSRQLAFVTVLSATLMLTACSANHVATESTSALPSAAPATTAPAAPPGGSSVMTPAQIEAISSDARGDYATLVSKYPDAKIPLTTTVRHVALDEWPTAEAACLTEQGFPTSVSSDGGASGHVQSGSDKAFKVAAVICDIKYPLEERFEKPLTTAQIHTLWTYQTTVLTQCLNQHGLDVPAAPSLVVFAQGYATGRPWNPYADDGRTPTATQLNELDAACPATPAGLQ